MAIDAATLRNELDALTHELGHLLRHAATHQTGANAQATTEPIEAAISALRSGLSDGDLQLEQLIRARPIMATATAFTIGMAIGLLLRRT
ncbi:conserved protein of unknown function [Bradyrhizobium sp. ORS 285]|uniref:hypothetical protein n=1 Tax=Bradyrhizobium sp. ORS 285 TaxID=115808 RepID=UPI0002407DEF|nr:hypothetical protein [Bradyrhizobium sp. ORS 285]CCD84443.1 conserved hypothetical protein [Bradyrhizobium sp. ORS 285]SMX57085.1 conserved protein of unknown function [Bradyrhizobium sp. ORS 285]